MTTGQLLVRPYAEADLPALTDLYNHYILTSPATFHTEVQTLVERREWASHYDETGRHRLFVAARDGLVLGFASSSPFSDRQAYDPSVSTSVYVHHEAVGQGVGVALYEELFRQLASEPIHRAYAGITMPNPASLALHRRFGFREVGTYQEVGFKFGRYWDVLWLQKEMPN